METRTETGLRQRPCGRHGLCFHPLWGFWVRITIWLVKGGTLCYLSLLLFYLFLFLFLFYFNMFLFFPRCARVRKSTLDSRVDWTGLGAKQTYYLVLNILTHTDTLLDDLYFVTCYQISPIADLLVRLRDARPHFILAFCLCFVKFPDTPSEWVSH